MKRFLNILFAVFLLAGCNQDENVFSVISASYYPTTSAFAEEEDGVVYTVQVEASGALGANEGSVEIRIDSEVEGSIAVTDGEGNLIEVIDNRFTVNFEQDTVETSTDIRRVQVVGTFGIEALNDLSPEDYVAEFRIVGTSGRIEGISSTNVFTFVVRDKDTVPVFEDDFENGLSQWTIIDLGGNNTWEIDDFVATDNTASSSTYRSDDPASEENWLISPVLNFEGAGSLKLNFESRAQFRDEDNVLEVFVLQDFDGVDPGAATQIRLNPILDPHEGTGRGDWTPSGDVDLSEINGSGQIAFRFTSVGASDGTGWQVDDVSVGFFNPDASGGGPANIVDLPFAVDFENCTTDGGIADGFTEAFVDGFKTDRGWGCAQTGVDGSRAIRANAFGGSAGDEDAWLITLKRINLRNVGAAAMSFDVKSENAGDGTLRAYYSTNYFGGDPSAYIWNELDISGQLPVKGSGTYSNVNVSLSAAIGQRVYLALRFEGASASNSATFDIDNINVESSPLIFFDDFESCVLAGEFNIPSNWIEEVVPGSKTDRGWGCRNAGRSGWAPRASAFGGEDGNDDAWLITNGTIDLTGVATAQLVVWVESRFSGPGDLEFKWSSDYAGAGDPTSATWTTLSDVADQLPADGSDTFTEVTSDLSGAVGNEIYLAFRYFGGTSSASVAFTIDDLSVTGN